VYSFAVLKAIILVICLNITSYFFHLCIYCGDKYFTLDVSNFRSTLDNYGSATYLICRQDSGKKEGTGAGSSLSSPPRMVGFLEE